jgi:hypothetical protein
MTKIFGNICFKFFTILVQTMTYATINSVQMHNWKNVRGSKWVQDFTVITYGVQLSRFEHHGWMVSIPASIIETPCSNLYPQTGRPDRHLTVFNAVPNLGLQTNILF